MAGSRRPGSLPRRVERRLARAAALVLTWEKARARRTRIELTLLAPAAMRKLNRRATGRRGMTDVLAFALPQPDGTILGDVYLCRAAARDWVRRNGRSGKGAAGRVEEELVRLAVHGTLHVLGYDHPEGDHRTRSAMWRRQERYVKRLARAGQP
ncbi:MAG TPA: rRNA maturation RNase YbeY [Gemmatimonadales bacterium]|nr:rRNA maturation RNase YbeY [Gemmatimonadales bacterium]